MLTPLQLYVVGALLLILLAITRFLPRKDATGWLFAAVAATAVESGLLTEFGLILPSGLLLMLLGIDGQLFAAAIVLLLNATVAWLLFRLLSGHAEAHRHA